MAVRVRLTRVGNKKNAMWRVVVADQRSPRDGRFIEMIGHYNPQTEPSQIVIDRDRLDHWLERGAKPSDTVRKLMRAEVTPAGATAPVDTKPEGVGSPAEAPEASSTPPEANEEAETVADTEGTTPDTEGSAEGAAPEASGTGGDDAPQADDAKSG